MSSKNGGAVGHFSFAFGHFSFCKVTVTTYDVRGPGARRPLVLLTPTTPRIVLPRQLDCTREFALPLGLLQFTITPYGELSRSGTIKLDW